MGETPKLTKAGWPRPIIDGWPIPWVSPSDDLSTMNPARERICADGKVCAVCGEENGGTSYILIRSNRPPKDLSKVRAHAMDNGVLHRRCAALAIARCPELSRLQSNGLLQIVKCKTSDIRPRATLDGAKCEIVSRAALITGGK